VEPANQSSGQEGAAPCRPLRLSLNSPAFLLEPLGSFDSCENNHPAGSGGIHRLSQFTGNGTRRGWTAVSRRGAPMKAIVVTNQAGGTAGMTLAERPKPQAAINDVVVQVHASGFVGTELAWPSTWTDRLDRDRTPSIPGHELAGVVTALGYGTTGLS